MSIRRTAGGRIAARAVALAAGAAACVFIFRIQCAASVTLAGGDGAMARIEAPSDISPAEAQAIADLKDALQARSEGQGPETLSAPTTGRIVLERTGEAPASLADAESFSAVAADNVLRLRAKTPEGLCQAIYWFLRARAGVRWYAPGEAATFTLRGTPWVLADFDETPKPSFVSRVLYGLGDGQAALWARRNALGNPVAFSHHLAKVITPALLAAHPEWRCVFAGKQTPPAQARFYQPELHDETLVRQGAAQASRFFEANPGAFSFSLGLDDNTRFSQSQGALAARGPLRFYRGLPDYSDTVFRFMNAAAEALPAKDSGRYLGCLAYQWNTDTPAFSVNPAVAPFVASDRAFWHLSAFRADETALLQRWGKAGPPLWGLYDYLYGNPFLIPRPLTRLPQWLRAGYEAGARAYFAEAGAIPEYDGQKLWLAAALLWDIDADPRALAEEWERARYGAAAPQARAFFKLWNDAWESQGQNTYWLRNYADEAQGLLASPQALDEMGRLLAEAAAAVCDDPARATAVAALRERFALTDAFCRLTQAKAALADAADPRDAREADALYKNLIAFMEARARFQAALAEAPAAEKAAARATVRSDPSVGALVQLAQRARAQGRLHLYMNSLRKLAAHPGATDAFRDALAAFGSPRPPAPGLSRNRLENPALYAVRPVAAADFNPLWPEYGGALPEGWELRAVRTETLSVSLQPLAGRFHEKALAVSGAENAHLFQWTNLPAGTPIFFGVRVRGVVAPGAHVLLILTWSDARGARHTREARLFPGDYPDGRTLWMIAPALDRPTRCALGVIVAHQIPGQTLQISEPDACRIPPRAPGRAHRYKQP